MQGRVREHHSCHVDEDVDARLYGQRLFTQASNVINVRQIAEDHLRSPPHCADLVGHLLQFRRVLWLVPPCQDQICTVVAEVQRCLFADASARTGHESPPTLQGETGETHWNPLVRCYARRGLNDSL